MKCSRGKAPLILVVLLLLLGASSTGMPIATASAAPDSFPVTIEHKYGSTTIPQEPERVVDVSFNGQDFVLALGVTPVGVREWIGGYEFQTRPWARSRLQGVELETVGGNELDFERIASLSRPYSWLVCGPYQGGI
jgi:iron complex transport system substrate-binding protein